MQAVKPDFLAVFLAVFSVVVSLGDFLVFFLGRIDFFADFSPHVQEVS